MEKNNVAIILPAYKPDFLNEAIESVLRQKNKRFNLYIFNDASPFDIDGIVNQYLGNHSNIFYYKFEENLGSKNLVAHWNRCVNLIKNEEWIWLFSDDDLMSDNCISSFYETIKNQDSLFDVYRFQSYIIDENSKTVSIRTQHPKVETPYEFLRRRLEFNTLSFIVDYIFSKSVYYKHKGFVDFEAAWCADDATWILFGGDKNIFTLEDAEIFWRMSSINISGNISDIVNREKKKRGGEQFFLWVIEWLRKNKMPLDFRLLQNSFMGQLVLLNYKNKFWPYVSSKPFRLYFWNKNIIFQFKYLTKEFIKLPVNFVIGLIK